MSFELRARWIWPALTAEWKDIRMKEIVGEKYNLIVDVRGFGQNISNNMQFSVSV